jgi:hypothetical protein
MLALIDTQRDRDREDAKIPVRGRIAIRATLILVPRQLPEQWDREIQKFLNKNRGYNVIVIKSAIRFRKLTIADFQKADIIILSWCVCDGDAYQLRVAQFAGMVELPRNPTRRASTIWYEHALEATSEHVEQLQGGGKGFHEMISQKLAASKSKAASEETFIPSKRLRGQAYQDAKQGPATGSKRTYAVAFPDDLEDNTLTPREDFFGLEEVGTGKKHWTSMNYPILELFEFGRIVVDEYTYVAGHEALSISKLKAKARWMLSGTPPIQDFVDVKCISKFLGINLGTDDLTPGVINSANIRALEKDRTSK